MTKAFLDTTVLTDRLLKPGTAANQAAKAAMSRFQTTLLPVYAIKEFKAGPLYYFVWFYNKLALHGSLSVALEALQRISRTPRRYLVSTAIEALRAAVYAESETTLRSLVARYGADARLDSVQSTKSLIMRAWRRRRSVSTAVVEELACYREVDPVERRGLLSLEPTDCQQPECCLAPRLKSAAKDLLILKEVLKNMPETRERVKRRQTLSDIARKPRVPVTRQMCRNLGDAIFTLLCPDDATILTTNLRGHAPLAAALGKRAESPQERQ